MNTRFLYLFLFLLIAFSVAKSQTFNLTVTGGLGSGIYSEGDTVHVWSNAIFADSVFVDWTGSGAEYMAHSNEWHSAITVPPGSGIGSIGLIANYDVIPHDVLMGSVSYLLFAMDAGNELNVMKESFYAVPPSPKGVVFLLHGTGGKGENFFKKYERFSLIKDFVYDGYAVFTLETNNTKATNRMNNQSVNIYPNPFNNNTTIEFNNLINELFTFRLFTASGKLVRAATNITVGRIEIRREGLAGGLYYYQLLSGNQIRASGKLIIE